MNTNLTQLKDEFFRTTMAQLPVAREFFEAYLSKEVLELVNLDTLVLEKGTFIDEAFKANESDLLYSVKLLNGSTAYIYFLYKHDGEEDRMIAFRLFSSKIEVMKNHIAQHPEAPLPLVFPLVFYTP